MASLASALIGEYRVTELLGAGGMGEVYKATHTHFGRVIAIKVLSAGGTDPSTVRRFYSEASIQASLRHPGVAEYLGFYEYQGRPCILMEYVDGETLSSILERRGALPAEEALRVARALAAVVAHFHTNGVLHRDIKSSNVKINSDGSMKVLDFGIARLQTAKNLTRTGMIVGTPGVLAPEQVRGETITPATDVWQLGVLMYEMLTGRLPFDADNTPELYAKILNAKFEPISNLQPSLPVDFEKVVNRCLQKDPNKRFASGGELSASLVALELEKRAPAVEARTPVARQVILRRAGAFVGGAIVLIAIAVLGLRIWQQESASACVEASSTEGAASSEMGTVIMRIGDAKGEAQVYCNGKHIGLTPFTLHARIGDKVNLTLRREGYKDLAVPPFSVTKHMEPEESMDPLEKP